MTKEEKQYTIMTKTPINRLIIKLGLPTVISMLVTAIYNMADTYFVSQLGTSASGAVGIVFPLMAIIQAIGFTLGMGSGSIISRKLGEKKDDEAKSISSSAFYVAIVIGIIITFLGQIFVDVLMKFLGASPTILPYAKDYAVYILYGSPIMAGSFVMNNLLRAEGKAKFSMIGLTIGGLLNIVLDPLFIYTLGLGISGAAIATLISQSISFMILLCCFLFKKSILSLNPARFNRKFSVYASITANGLPSLLRQGLASIATILLNIAAGGFGDYAVSAMSIVGKVFFIIFSVALGIGQGFQPVCGYNYSSKNYRRVKQAIIFTYLCGTGLMLVCCIAFFIFASDVVSIFISDKKVIEVGSSALRYQCISMPIMMLGVICNMTFQATGKKFRASLLACCRQGIFYIPSILILPALFGITGVEICQTVSDVFTFIFAIPFAVQFLRSLNKQQKAIDLQRQAQKQH